MGVGDEVADDEEVGRETHLDDDVELAVGAIEVFLRISVPGNRRVASPFMTSARKLASLCSVGTGNTGIRSRWVNTSS